MVQTFVRTWILTAAALVALASSNALAQTAGGVGSAGAATSTASKAEFVVPPLTSPVVDAAGLLDRSTQAQLESGIRSLREQGGTQLTVLTVPSLGGLEIEQASIQVTDAWKLGGANTDNGVLLLVAPSERKVRIEVGQGLEGSLTDAFANRIVRDTILPEFRQQRFDRGIFLGVVEIIRKTNPDISIESLFANSRGVESRERSSRGGGIPRGLITLVFFIILISIFSGGGRGGRRRGSFSPWGSAALGYGLGRMGGGGGWGGGGGGFSGGGASGGW